MVYFVWYRPRERPPIPEVASLQRAYRLNDGRLLWFSSSADRNSLRHYFMSGETGLLIPSEASSPDRPTFSAGPGWAGRTPVEVTVSFDGSTGSTVQFSQGGKSYTGNRCEADIVDTQFTSQGTLLVGRLIMPRTESQVPIVVLVHGSEKQSAVWNNRFQFMLPAQEIGVVVYDKR
ncbi:MAG TPA: hypothetical protein DCF63_12220, partial [Planctomycetaceae bacterium]|nr:hypothetical protein [Planctomycetaceae bacterium]